MEVLILDIIALIRKHYTESNARHRQIEQQLAELEKLLSVNNPPQEKQYLFFHELTPDAQLEFLAANNLEIDDIDSDRPIAELKLLKISPES